MIDNEILDEIASTYAGHEKLDAILNDLNQNINVVYWANAFATESYSSNIDLAEALFEYALQQCEDYRDYKELAFAIGNSHGFDDKVWAKELLYKAIEKVERLRDLRVLADDIALKNDKCYEPQVAMELYKEAIEKSKTSYDYYCIAESLCSKDLLDDKDWATDVYQKAIEVAQDSDELTYIADSIADEDNLDDEAWADELYAIAQEYEEGK